MASTTAFYTGLSGLNANARNLDVIGNNIANVNTTSYKSSRLMFSTMFSRNQSLGTAPAESTGGTNPFQVGLGVRTAATQRNMNGGTISATGDARDLAIDGEGFFIVNRNGTDLYTRAGAFRLNELNEMVNISGERLQGYGVDRNFQIQPGQLGVVQLPVGSLSIAEATTYMSLNGALNTNGPLPSRGSRVLLSGTADAGLQALPTAAPAPTAPNLIEAGTRLVDLQKPGTTATPLFNTGDQFRLQNVVKGGMVLPTASLPVSATTTLQELATFIENTLGLITGLVNPDGRTTGVTIDGATGQIEIVGNTGTVNDLEIEPTDLRIVNSAGVDQGVSLFAGKSIAADGESVRTSMVAYDSLGTPILLEVSIVAESKANETTRWRYTVESRDDLDGTRVVGSGFLDFDSSGELIDRTPVQISLSRAGTGAATPMTINLSFADGEGEIRAQATTSAVNNPYRNGSSPGTLSSFSIGDDGTIVGIFTNSLSRVLGQVALANFTNPGGLEEVGGNLFRPAANSGNAVVTQPGTFGAGRILSGGLELSNVDLGDEFTKLILTSTGYSASSRVIRTADELMQQLLVLGR